MRIQQQNAYVAAGQIGMPPTPAGQDFQLTANVPAALSDAAEFEQIILKTDSGAGGQITRMRDVGRVEFGARSYSQLFKVDGRPAGGIAIYQLPGANALDTAKGVRKLLDSLAPGFPAGLTYRDSVRYYCLCARVSQRGLSHAFRSGRSGPDCHRCVPARLASDSGSGDDGAGDNHRRICGDGGNGF